MIKPDDPTCTACALDDNPDLIDPKNAVAWAIGRCKFCGMTKYLTPFKNFKEPEDEK